MKRWKAIAGVLLVFVLGMIAGGLVSLGVIRHQWRTRGQGAMTDFIVRRMSWRLRLDPTQREQLRAIVKEGQQEIQAVRKQVQPQVDEIFSRSDAKVRAILRPDQQARFDALVAERKERWQHRAAP
jgi:Spy/CpxP family protein refolding chaperone